MHSLYRGWEGDFVAITVGSGEEQRQFRGRRDLLVEHSGYLKSILDASPTGEVSVPSVSPDIFAYILSYINTGFLDLTPDNIYSVLLATHLLHMPRAVELCRSYLVFERHHLLTPPPTIVKPIPNRKYLPSLYWPPPPPPYFPFESSYPLSFIQPVEPLPSTSIVPDQSHFQDKQSAREEATLISTPPAHQLIEETPQCPIPSPTNTITTDEKLSKGVLKDIACCDGPVRFKRVLNVNYGTFSDSESQDQLDDKNPTRENRRIFICGFCKHTFKSHYCYRKHTRRHLNPASLNNAVHPSQKETKDMNVQYYPCKTCGSKFPSYYFVHKHRKLCHSAENYLQDKSAANSQNQEPVEP